MKTLLLSTQRTPMSQTSNKQLFVIIINSIVNVALAAAKILVGFLFQSQLLIADGVHSLSDLLTDIFAIIGLRAAQKPKDEDHPFGHGNLEYASSLTVSIVIFFMVYGLILELVSHWHILSPSINYTVLFVSIATFVIKLFLSWYVLYQAKKLDSHTLKSSGIESMTDAYSTIVVIIGLLITDYGVANGITWLIYAEKIATIFVIILLIKAGLEIYLNSTVGIAGAQASAEIQEHFFTIIKDTVVEHEKTFELTEFIILKQGIDYFIYIKIIFKKDMLLKDAEQKVETMKDMLYADARVKKVNVEFATNF